MTIEMDHPTLRKLCWLIAQQWKAELAYSRAQYRVSYYRKLKAKLEASKKTSEKWNDHLELAKKIESTRLTALKKQEDLLHNKKKFRSSLMSTANKLEARLIYKEGKIVAISVPTDDSTPLITVTKQIEATQILEYADQHEAEKALTRALTTKGNVSES